MDRMEHDAVEGDPQDEGAEAVAVIGLGGRLPGARTVDEFWRNQARGVESISRFSDQELLASGVEPGSLADPEYVRASAVIEGADTFDAPFFGFSPREAEILDPQHRVFLEVAWEALEDAGYDPARFPGAVGVFAGCFMNKYLATNLLTNERFVRSPAAFFARIYNDKDFLATRVAYLLNLRGPALTVQTACSTSLVATHLACQSLLAYDCDMALVGGVAVNVPLKAGYPVVDGGLFTPEGHCRPFDARAQGTVPGYGAGIVVLRRLSDALRDRDNIRAVIRGTAINNDGSLKVGFTAPSVDAQAEVIAAAQGFADVDPSTIGYLEAHGTGTPVGDPIEVAALTQAFRTRTQRRGFCALGSVKANIGHLDAAAGVAGLMRAVLALENRVIPPTVNFQAPNPRLELETTPFYVPTEPREWARNGSPRRAGVSSFGVGGTNAHAVLEEAPEPAPAGPARGWQLYPLSARSRAALDAATEQLAVHLEQTPDLRPADVAFTLQAGRQGFDHRRFVVARGVDEAARLLRSREGKRMPTAVHEGGRRQVVFTFPGGGTQHPDMGLEIYLAEPEFRADIDRCAEILRPRLGYDLRRFLYPSHFGVADVDPEDVPSVMASIIATEYALARQWMRWGVRPDAMIGHSLGEYAAACIAGVFSLQDALDLAVTRGELFARMPEGRMLAVQLGEDEVRARLGDRLSLAAVNAPGLTLVSGPEAEIGALAERLSAQEVEYRRVHIRVASHSWMVEPYLDEFTRTVARYRLNPPEIPFVSGVTGTWIRPGDATDPAYWARHLRQPVRFADGVRELVSHPGRVLLEVGPGNALTTLAAAQQLAPSPTAIASMRHPQEEQPDLAFLLGAVGRLWQAGVSVDWNALHGEAAPRRVPLPTYPWERRRHWIEPGRIGPAARLEVVDADEEKVVVPEIFEAAEDDLTAPRTPVERQLAELWRELLGVDRVGVDDDFFELGGHSLLISQMTKRLRQAFPAVRLEVRELFDASTVASLAALIEQRSGAPAPAAAGSAIDLEAEPALDEAIRGDRVAPWRPFPPRVVLLTGATGYLGAFLLAELLRQTQAEVRCLVRAADADEGVERIRRNLAALGLSIPDDGRLIAVPGDLARPRLGVDDEAWNALAHEVDAVYHCGAWVNFARPYRALRQTNVGGTQEVLRLASTERLKPVHHVSTLAVLAGAYVAGVDEVREDAPLPPPVGHDTGYSQSKWVAEKVVEIARGRGLPVSIYRPGVVLGDTRSGASNAEDYITRIIQGCVQLGLAPLRSYPLSVGAADRVAADVVTLSLHPETVGQTFHTVDARPLHWDRIFDHVRAFGYPVESIPYDAWKQALAERVERDPDNALEPLLGLLSDTADRRSPRVDRANVVAALGPDAEESAIDGGYFAGVLRWMAATGLLPPPPPVTAAVEDAVPERAEEVAAA